MNNALDLKSILPDSVLKLHHAYCLEGRRKNILKELLKFLENNLEFNVKGNPDFYLGDFETLGIDEGRAINEMQSRKAVSSLRRIFIITANSITKEAQNSLLKMFEEPSGGAVFFLIIPAVNILLPTLKSRMMIINFNRNGKFNAIDQFEESATIVNAEKFIKAETTLRLVMVKNIADKIADGEISKSAAIDFLNDVERKLANDIAKESVSKKDLFVFGEIDKCRSYAGDRSPSLKTLLEHIAMIL